jgi:hypothetical protein
MDETLGFCAELRHSLTVQKNHRLAQDERIRPGAGGQDQEMRLEEFLGHAGFDYRVSKREPHSKFRYDNT